MPLGDAARTSASIFGEETRPNGWKAVRLPEAAGRIGGRRNVRSRWGRSGICGNFGWRRLGQTDPCVHLQVLFSAARAKGFARIFIAQAGQLIAAVDAVAISRRRCGFDRYQCHGNCPLFCRIVQVPRDFRKALTGNGRGMDAEFQQQVTTPTKFSTATGGTAFRYFLAIRSTELPAWPGILRRPPGRTEFPRSA